MPDSVLRIILDFVAGAAPAQLGALAADLQGVGAAAATADAGLAGLTPAAGAATESLGAYNVETGMALTGTEGLGAAMAAFDAEVAATAAAEAELAVTTTTAAASMDVMATANTIASSTMMSLAGAGIAVGLAIGGAKVVFDNTVGSAAALGLQARKLSLEIGSTAEESSKLIYAADVVGVSVNTMTRSINIAIRALATHKSLGIEPNIEGLGLLADRYVAIEDPIKRTAFLLHEFGRSGAEMASLMLLGSAGIKALGDQAALTGAVLSDSAAKDLHAYSVATNQLTIDVKAAGVALGVELAPAALRVADGALNLTHTLELVTAAQKDGIITAFGQNVIYAELATGTRSLKSVYDELSAKVQVFTDAQKNSSDAMDAADKAMLGIAVTQAASNPVYSDAASIIADYTGNVNLMAETQWKAQLATDALTKAQTETNAMSMIQFDLTGRVTRAQQSYQDVLQKTQPTMQQLRAELGKYNALQGESVTVVNKGKYSVEQLDLANNKVLIGSERFQIAQEHLAQAHQHAKESAEAYATRLLSLQVAVQSAGDTWQSAQMSLDHMNGHMATSTTTTADYSKKIHDLNTQLDDLTDKQKDARIAMEKTDAEMVIQAAKAGLDSKQLADVSFALGTMDEPTWQWGKSMEAMTTKFDLNRDGMVKGAEVTPAYIAALVAAKQTLDIVNSQPVPFSNFPESVPATVRAVGVVQGTLATFPEAAKPAIDAGYNTALAWDAANKSMGSIPGAAADAGKGLANFPEATKPMQIFLDNFPESIKTGVTDPLNVGAGAAQNLYEKIAALQDKKVAVTTDYFENTYQTTYHNTIWHDQGTGHMQGGAAAGGSFVIPPGFDENYRVGPYVASSGEEVTITPAGKGAGKGGGGVTIINHINDAKSMALEHARQDRLIRDQHESLM